MANRIEGYALIGDCQTAALVGRDGPLDWLCFPRFDSPACFAALLGTTDHGQWLVAPAGDHGQWLVAPAGEAGRVKRTYRGDTPVLETTFTTDTGEAALVDCTPVRTGQPDAARLVVGRRGSVPIRPAT